MTTGKQPLPKPRAVIFDWDDTLVDNWNVAVQSLNAALVAMGEQPWSEEEARRRSGPSARDLFTQLFGDRWQEADRVFYDTFTRLIMTNIRVHEYAEDILRALADGEVYLAVVSNKRGPLLRKEVEYARFAEYFNSVVGAGDAPSDKPHPAPVLLALKDSGIEPGPDVWFIGDSHTDMQCAISAGCTPILIETKVPPEDLLIKNPPARRFKKHDELMEFVRGYFT